MVITVGRDFWLREREDGFAFRPTFGLPVGDRD